MLRRILVGIGVLIAAPLIGLPLWIVSHSTDLLSPADEDLEVSVSDVDPGANGYEHLRRAHAEAVWPDGWEERVDDLDPRRPDDAGWLGQLLAENREAFVGLERFIAAPRSVFPVFDPGDSEPGDPNAERDEGTFNAVSLVRLAAARARLARARGRIDEAIDSGLLGVRAGGAFARSENPVLVDMMIAVSLQRRGILSLEETTRNTRLTPTQARALVRELEANRIPADAWRRMWAGEHQFVKRVLATVRDGPIPDAESNQDLGLFRFLPRSFLYQHNRTLALHAARARRHARAFSEICAAAPVLLREDERLQDRSALLVEMLRGNSLGVVWAAVPTPNFERFNLRRCAGDARLSILEAAIAARVATRVRGAPPETLAALVPEFLDAVPRDAFDGEPIRYDAERATISSIGSDLTLASPIGPLWLGVDDEPGTYVR